MSDYCDISNGHPLHGPYHDKEYGFPETNEIRLFERLSLEIMQAGLAWLTILKKRPGIKRAFSEFNIDSIAKYDSKEIDRLLNDPEIIRNNSKIIAIINNAQKIRELRNIHGSFSGWIDFHHPMKQSNWVVLFKNTFSFTGEQITTEFLKSIGYLPGAHKKKCNVYREVIKSNPPWLNKFNSKKIDNKNLEI